MDHLSMSMEKRLGMLQFIESTVTIRAQVSAIHIKQELENAVHAFREQVAKEPGLIKCW